MEMTKNCSLTCYDGIFNISEKFVAADLYRHIAEFLVCSSPPIGILGEIPTSPFFYWHIFMSVWLMESLQKDLKYTHIYFSAMTKFIEHPSSH